MIILLTSVNLKSVRLEIVNVIESLLLFITSLFTNLPTTWRNLSVVLPLERVVDTTTPLDPLEENIKSPDCNAVASPVTTTSVNVNASSTYNKWPVLAGTTPTARALPIIALLLFLKERVWPAVTVCTAEDIVKYDPKLVFVVLLFEADVTLVFSANTYFLATLSISKPLTYAFPEDTSKA